MKIFAGLMVAALAAPLCFADHHNEKKESKQQTTDQSTATSGDQSTTRSGDHSATQSGHHSATQSGNQSATQSGDHSATQSGDHSATQSGDRSTTRSRSQSTTKSGDHSATQSGDHSATQSGDHSTTTRSGDRSNTTSATDQTTTGSTRGRSAAGDAEAMVSPQDRRFMMDAAQGNAAEIQLAQLAQQKATTAEAKELARNIEEDHKKAGEQLKAIAERRNVDLPNEPGPKHQALMTRLQKLDGAAFDNAYAQAMVKEHRADIAKFEKQAKSGMDTELKEFASGTLPHLREHLEQAQTVNGSMRSRSQ